MKGQTDGQVSSAHLRTKQVLIPSSSQTTAKDQSLVKGTDLFGGKKAFHPVRLSGDTAA